VFLSYEFHTVLHEVFAVVVFVNSNLQVILLTQLVCRYVYDLPSYQISTPCLVISEGSFIESK